MKTKQITFHNKDGSTYQGTWKDGKEHGYGISKDNGCTYEGDFVKGIPTDGIMEFDDGSMYGGGLDEKGEFHGTGIIIGEDGTQLLGTFVNGEMHGVFKVTNEEGYYDLGEYKHNKRHSYWREKYPDGSEWDVQYEDGKIVARSERKIELVPDK